VRSGDAPERKRSWEALVAAYWRPVYKHVRMRWRRPPEDAEDLTQAFFERAMKKGFFDGYDPERARFRTFLRLCLDRFVGNQEKARKRLKRGGGLAMLPLDFEAAESELAAAQEASPDALFDREWRRCVFTAAIEALRDALVAAGQADWFLLLERYDLCDPEARPTYETLAGELQLPVTTITNRLHKARRELRRLVLVELARITGTDQELRHEAHDLLGADWR